MHIPSHRTASRVRINMTPMIDVVFLLIIFFLVSSHLAKQEVQAEVNLPTAESSVEPVETGATRITVNIVPESGTHVVRLGSSAVNPLDLERRLGHEVATGRPIEVRLRADRTVPYEVIEPVMIACAKAGVWNVTFAVMPREKGR